MSRKTELAEMYWAQPTWQDKAWFIKRMEDKDIIILSNDEKVIADVKAMLDRAEKIQSLRRN